MIVSCTYTSEYCNIMYYLVPIAIKISFDRFTYFVDENNKTVELMAILSNPSATDITVQFISSDVTAMSKYACTLHSCYITHCVFTYILTHMCLDKCAKQPAKPLATVIHIHSNWISYLYTVNTGRALNQCKHTHTHARTLTRTHTQTHTHTHAHTHTHTHTHRNVITKQKNLCAQQMYVTGY